MIAYSVIMIAVYVSIHQYSSTIKTEYRKEQQMRNSFIIPVNDTDSKNVFVCSICQKFFKGAGNDPYPVTKGENDRCCNECNQREVIPARMKARAEK